MTTNSFSIKYCLNLKVLKNTSFLVLTLLVEPQLKINL